MKTYNENNIDMEKNYDVTASGRLIWSSAFEKNTSGLENKETDGAIVIVVNTANPVIEVLDASDLNEDEKKYLVTKALNLMTAGCNYHYSIVSILANTYFCN